MSATEVAQVDVPGARLHAERTGRGPTLLLIPGGGGDAGVFDETRAHLADRFTVVSFDRRGNSRSTLDPGAAVDLGTQADDAAAVLDRFAPGTALVFGSSGGALITLELLARHADRVRAAVAHEPPVVAVLGPDSPERRELAALHRLAARHGPLRGYAAFGAMTLPDPPRLLTTAVGQALVARASAIGLAVGAALRAPTRRSPGVMTRQLGNAGHLMRVEMPLTLAYQPPLDRLAAVTVPWCLAVGRDSTGKPYERPPRVLAEHLGVPCRTFPGGHTEYVTRPAEFAATLTRAFADLVP